MEDDDQQLVKIKEWIPPLIARFQTVTIDKKDIFFILEVQDMFVEHYLELSELFFEVTPKDEEEKRKKAIKEHSDNSIVSLEDIWNSIKKH